MTNEKNEQARQQAKAQLASIIEMVAALTCDYERLEELREAVEAERANLPEFRKAEAVALALSEEEIEELKELEEAAGDCESEEEARQRIEEDALSVEVRGDWHSPGDKEGSKPSEFKILLCTGGPAVQIIGELDEHSQPSRARLQYQDWFTPWEELVTTGEENDALLTYSQVFYFGG